MAYLTSLSLSLLSCEIGLVIISASKYCDDEVIKWEVVSKEPQPNSLQGADRVLVPERQKEAGSRADFSRVSDSYTPLPAPAWRASS